MQLDPPMAADFADNGRMTDARIVLTTLDDAEQAHQLATHLVELRLAACVNLVERVCSVYRWQGNVETADEVLLIIKTTVERVAALKEEVEKLHPYQLPEFVVLHVTDGSDPYLTWLLAASRKEAE